MARYGKEYQSDCMKPDSLLRADAEHGLQVLRTPGGLLTLDVETGLLGFFLLEQVQAHAPEDGEVLGPVAHADATVVFGEGHVQHPVALVLDAPVHAHRGLEPLGAELRAAGVVALLGGHLAQRAHVVGHDALARLDAAVALVHHADLGQGLLQLAAVVGLEQALDGLGQCGLVVLDRDDVVRGLGHDGVDHHMLATHGIERQDGALDPCEPRRLLPSMAISSPVSAGHRCCIQRTKKRSN